MHELSIDDPPHLGHHDRKRARQGYWKASVMLLEDRRMETLNPKTGLRAQVARGVFGSFMIKLGETGLNLAASILLARMIGTKGYGIYVYALALITMLVIPAAAGLPTVIVRHVAAYRARGQWGLMRGLLQRASQAVLPLSLSLMIVAGVVGWIIAERVDPHALQTFWIALLLIPLLSLNALRGATLRGLHHVLLGQIPEQLIAPGLFVALVGAAVISLDRQELTAARVMSFQVIAVAVAFAIGTWMLLKRAPASLRQASAAYETSVWAKTAFPLILVGGMQFANHQIDILMLGAMKGAEAAGVYRVATRGADLVVFVLASLNMALAPTVARLYAVGDMRTLQRLVFVGTRAALIASFPVAVAFIAFGPWILGTIFGANFASGSTALAILCAGQLVNAGTGPVALLLNMTGHERDTALGVGVAFVVNIVLNALLVPVWGIEGAATATAISMITWNVILAICVYRRIRIRSLFV